MSLVNEFFSFQNGYAFKSSDFVYKGKYKIIKIKELKDGLVKFFDDTAEINVPVNFDVDKYIVRKGDVLFALTGDPVNKPNPLSWVGRVSYYDHDEPALLNQRVCKAIPKGNIPSEYLYYFFRQEKEFYRLASKATGSASQANISTKTIEQHPITVPAGDISGRIIDFLRNIDVKISVNEAINRNLYEQIGTLCEAWLTDYEPFGGVCPEDWIVTPLSDIAEFISGYSYKGKELVEESKVAMATIKNFERKGGFKLDGYKTIEPSDKLKEVQHVELFDTLVAHTDLTQNADVIGNAELVLSKFGYDDIVFSMDLVKVLPKNESISPFLLAALLHSNSFKQHCLGYVNGTTVLHLSKKALPDYKLPLPKDMSQLKTLDRLLEVLYKQIATNIESNIRFEKLRDSLLPMLMSGKLDVSDLNI